MKTGKSHDYFWLVSSAEIDGIDKLIIKYHRNYILHLATFDSGPLAPSDEEKSQGWSTDGEIMFSPPLRAEVTIPYEQYDEWYLSKEKLNFPVGFDRFVNYGGFNVAPDSEFEPDILDEFWKQLIGINPETYVAIGDNDIVISKNETLIKYISKNA